MNRVNIMAQGPLRFSTVGKLVLRTFDILNILRFFDLPALLIHDGSTAYVSVYGLVMTGSAELFTLDADVNSGNARLLATSASTNSTEYKVIRQSMLV